jgi:predicted nucleic acid-binding protein
LTLVDSNVLIDVINDDPAWFEWSARALTRAADSGPIAINQIIYAELSVRYQSIDDFETAVTGYQLERLDLPWDAAFLAGKAYKRYRDRGGSKAAPMPDFYIGAHAAVSGLTLLTRDARRYREYFPKLKIVAPA